MSCTPEQYIDEYGEPPPGLEGYAHHNPVHTLMKHVKSHDPQSIISSYQNPNQPTKEGFGPCFNNDECGSGQCVNKQAHLGGLGVCTVPSISGYQNPNQHHNGHHDGQGLEGYIMNPFKGYRSMIGNNYTKAKGSKCSKHHECKSNQCNSYWDSYNERGYKICE